MADELIGAATTDADVKGVAFHIQLVNDRLEYKENTMRAGKKLAEAFQNDPDLYRAFSYLAQDTPFAIMFASNEPKRIIIPSVNIPGGKIEKV